MKDTNKNRARKRGRSFDKRSKQSGPRRFSQGRRNERSRGKRGAQTLPSTVFINKEPVVKHEETYVSERTFNDFGLDGRLVENLEEKGYTCPTRIQDEAIPHICAGSDVVGLANTGSGKTAAFILPIIDTLTKQTSDEMSLIVTPTRELAQQIQKEFNTFSSRMKLSSVLCVGGLNMRAQIRDLRRHPNVIIGTPGRLKDLLDQREIKSDTITTLVLDEADRMLDMGFLPDITYIIDTLPKQRQSLCFSATTNSAINKLFARLLNDPVTISVRTSETGEHIAQDVITVRSPADKMTQLTEMLNREHFERVLIFGEMKHHVQKLANTLNKQGFAAEAIHGNKSQPQRKRALDMFRNGKVNILVATDVAARGLDIPNVSHVINFDQPRTRDDYIHRIGRTGRAGKQGQAYTFVS